MTIRFQCSACSQPIEVDDEWAQRAVACPYCRRTITAPAESTLADLTAIPSASPIGGGGAAPVQRRNTIAVVALVLACLMVVLYIGSCTVAGAHRLEYQQFVENMEKKQAEGGSMIQAMSEYLEENEGSLPPAFMVVSLLQFAAMAACLAAVICGLIGLINPHRRSLAVIALFLSGGLLVLLCAGLVVGSI